MFISEETIYNIQMSKEELKNLEKILSQATRNILSEDQESLLNDLSDTLENILHP